MFAAVFRGFAALAFHDEVHLDKRPMMRRWRGGWRYAVGRGDGRGGERLEPEWERWAGCEEGGRSPTSTIVVISGDFAGCV